MTEAANRKCVFCDIAAGKAPAHIVAEDGLSVCILDIHPYTKGHCLVISKRHVPWWHELSDEENASLFKPGPQNPPYPSISDSDLQRRCPGPVLQRPGKFSGIPRDAGKASGTGCNGRGGDAAFKSVKSGSVPIRCAPCLLSFFIKPSNWDIFLTFSEFVKIEQV